MSPEDEARMLHAEHMLSRAVTAEASLLVRDARVAELERALENIIETIHYAAAFGWQRTNIAEVGEAADAAQAVLPPLPMLAVSEKK